MSRSFRKVTLNDGLDTHKKDHMKRQQKLEARKNKREQEEEKKRDK